MILHFRTDPEFNLVDSTTTWRGQRAIDLKWVAAAAPMTGYGADAVRVWLGGGTEYFYVDCPYSKFMELWMETKEEK